MRQWLASLLKIVARTRSKSLKTTQQAFRRNGEAGEPVAMAIQNHAFHRIIGEMADNAFLMPSLNRLLIDHTRLGQQFYRPNNARDRQLIWKASEQHDANDRSDRKGRAARAVELTLEHWALSRDQMEKYVRPDPLPLDIGSRLHLKVKNMQFEGIYTPVVTPYNEDFSLNKKEFEKAIEHLIASGVHGIIVAGTTGEYYAQSADERVDLMKLAKKIIGKRLPLIIGTGAIRTEDSIFFAEHAKAIGADALLIATPPYAYPTAREIALHALAIDRAANHACHAV